MRRFHHKSRHGCGQCRKRRVKCDGTKLRCRNCVRLHLQCSFEFLQPVKPGCNTPHTKPGQDSVGKTRPEPYACLANYPVDLKSMELLYHYTSVAHYSLGRMDSMHIWRIDIPSMALSHDFLMCGILAISALHLATLQPHRSLELRQRAASYEQKAMPSFRRHTAELDTKSGIIHAVFAFAGFIPPYLLAQSRWLDAPEGRIPSLNDDQPHWFHALRGLSGLLFRSWAELAKGPFGPCLVRAAAPIDYSLNPNDADLLSIHSLLEASPSATSACLQELAVCREALDELRRVCALSYSPCKTLDATAALYIWPGSISSDFLTLLHKRRREALIVLVQYCGLFQRTQNMVVWYHKGVADAMMRAINNELGGCIGIG